MTIRELLENCGNALNKFGNWFMSLTLGEFFMLLCAISIFIYFISDSNSESEKEHYEY